MDSQQLRIGIVGSRRRNTLADRKIVFRIVQDAIAAFPEKEIVVVSGGAKGPDTFAEEAAKHFGLQFECHPIPRDPPITTKWEFVQRAFGRNKTIAERSAILFALVNEDRKGGTENTIEHSDILKKTFFLVDQAGRVYLKGVGWNDQNGQASDKT